MIKMSMKLPKQIAVAVSGGCDSMAALDFLSNNRDVVALHFNHGTEYAPKAEEVVLEYCRKKEIPLIVGRLEEEIPSGSSKEEFWRDQRYKFFDEASRSLEGMPIVTCHHLDDLVETWIFTSLHGSSTLIPSVRGKYHRPFLVTRKTDLEDWCDRKEVPFLEDPSNLDTSFMRNFIRHELVPRALRVNPGLPKVLRKKVLNNPLVID